MRFEYDNDADALDIAISDGIVARTVEVDPGTLIDLDERGAVVAIELIRPERRWPLDEIIEQFDLAADVVAVLRALQSKQLDFAEPAPLALA